MDRTQHLYAPPTGIALAKVTDSSDSKSRGLVKVTLIGINLDVWASCLVPSAGAKNGNGYGIAMLPKNDEIVLVAFLSPEQVFVLGSVWSGGSTQPGESTPVEQRYAVKTPSGTTMVFDDSGPSLSITTPANNSITLTDSGGGSCTVQLGGTSIQTTTDSVTVTTTSSVQIQTSTLSVTAASVSVNAAMSQFSGVVQCDTLIATSVVGTTYTPGAGNIW